jgi:hypothetical protein
MVQVLVLLLEKRAISAGGIMKTFWYALSVLIVVLLLSGSAIAETDADYERALQAYHSGRYSETVGILKEYVEKNPDPSAYYLIGYSLYELGRYDEATEYFEEAYLIDPVFATEKIGFEERFQGKPAVKKEKARGIGKSTINPEAVSAEKVTPASEPGSPAAPAGPPETAPSAAPPVPSTPPASPVESQPLPPPPAEPSFPESGKELPDIPSGILKGLFAGFIIIPLLIGLAFYIYWSLCLFKIAKKLNVEAAWTAWVPIIQIWPVVGSAGKPWWWILLLFVPLVNLIVGIYLWMCISENLGRNKWLGLLMLVPVVNLIFLGVLAFSKTEQPDYSMEGMEGFNP